MMQMSIRGHSVGEQHGSRTSSDAHAECQDARQLVSCCRITSHRLPQVREVFSWRGSGKFRKTKKCTCSTHTPVAPKARIELFEERLEDREREREREAEQLAHLLYRLYISSIFAVILSIQNRIQKRIQILNSSALCSLDSLINGQPIVSSTRGYNTHTQHLQRCFDQATLDAVRTAKMLCTF